MTDGSRNGPEFGAATIAMLCEFASICLLAAIWTARERDDERDGQLGLAQRAQLLARQGQEPECRACAAEALRLSEQTGVPRDAVRAVAALGELELSLGNAAESVKQLERQQRLLRENQLTDVDLSPAAELVDAYLRLGRADDARRVAREFTAAAIADGRPRVLARALRCEGQLADSGFASYFRDALRHHAHTTDVFETARTRLAYGERLRRAQDRVLAREQLHAALEIFEHLKARPWAHRARAELAASSQTQRRRDPTTVDQLTPQELQIGLLLASGKTTRQAAAALFLSPKTIEYHLRHVYQKLAIHSREELTQTLNRAPTLARAA
jgi:DNA-binding CsgD family transcriptional regulator